MAAVLLAALLTTQAVAQTPANQRATFQPPYAPANVTAKTWAPVALANATEPNQARVGIQARGTLSVASFGPDPERAPILDVWIIAAKADVNAGKLSMSLATIVLEDVVPTFAASPDFTPHAAAPAVSDEELFKRAKSQQQEARRKLDQFFLRLGDVQCLILGAASDAEPLARCVTPRGQTLQAALVEAGLGRPRISAQQRMLP